jgi:glutamine synthetase
MKQGIHATFMPKPIEGQPGSGMHIHQSLFYTGKKKSGKAGVETNAFYDAKDPLHLSRVAKCYIAGLLKHAREMAIVTNQWVNSYKRLVSGYEAPTAVVWGHNNRSALVRIPAHKKGKDHAVRAEFRSPDPACNPYLVYSVMLAAGLRGIQKNYRLGPPIEESAEGIEQLLKNLGEAIEAAESSEFLKQALGAHLFHSLIENKKIEWQKFNSHVSSYELKKDLPTL